MNIPPLPPSKPNSLHSSITIATQIVGGMRDEIQLKKSPKLFIIRKLITPATYFFILTEIRAD
jgi:hypothetical protein